MILPTSNKERIKTPIQLILLDGHNRLCISKDTNSLPICQQIFKRWPTSNPVSMDFTASEDVLTPYKALSFGNSTFNALFTLFSPQIPKNNIKDQISVASSN